MVDRLGLDDRPRRSAASYRIQPARRRRPAHSRTSGRCATLAAVSVLTALDSFFTEHGRGGRLDSGVEGPIVWMSCDCGASMVRRVSEDH
jgi:hypothetical protein